MGNYHTGRRRRMVAPTRQRMLATAVAFRSPPEFGGGAILPATRVANVAHALLTAVSYQSYPGQLDEVRQIARQLYRLAELHEAGELGPIVDDGSPF